MALFDFLGKGDRRDTNTVLGLLNMAAGAFDPRARTTGDAVGAALGGGLGFAGQVQQQNMLRQKLAQQKALQESQIGLNKARTDKLSAPPPQYKTVQNPFGLGGVGQMGPGGKLVNYQKPNQPKAPDNYLLPSGEYVLSHDFGKTYVGKDGESRPMPGGARRVGLSVQATDVEGLSKKTKGDIEKQQFNAVEGLSRLENIQKQFRPEFQQYAPRLSAGWSAIKERAGMDVSREDKKFLTDFSKFRRQSLDNINRYIKEITGAQMSVQEAARLRKGLPDPGEHWYNGDSPTQFQAKLQDTMNTLKAAVKRYEYARQKGLSLEPDKLESELPLEQFMGSETKRRRYNPETGRIE